MRGELIADGVHVHPAAMNALMKLLGPERIMVDAERKTWFVFQGEKAPRPEWHFPKS